VNLTKVESGCDKTMGEAKEMDFAALMDDSNGVKCCYDNHIGRCYCNQICGSHCYKGGH